MADLLNDKIDASNISEVHRYLREIYIRRISEADNALRSWQNDINTNAYPEILEQIPEDLRTKSFEELVPELSNPKPNQSIIDEQRDAILTMIGKYTDMHNNMVLKQAVLLEEARELMRG